MGIGNKIGTLLKEQGRSAAWLSRETKIPATTLRSMISRDSDRADIDTLEKVAKALGCSVLDLISKEAFEKASDSDKVKISNMAFDAANDQINRASNICELAGYVWKWDSAKDGLIHLIDKKTKTEYAVTDELFTAAVDGSLDYIDYNFKKLIKSAKIINNGK